MLIYWHIDMLIFSYFDIFIYWYTDILVYWYVDILIYWHIDMLIYWYVDIFIYWYKYIWMYWYVDILTYWYVDILNSACNTDTTPTQPHRNSNTQGTKNNTTNVVIQLNSRKYLMMDILMSETCWAHKKWNKIASDIKLVFYSWSIRITLF